MLTLSRKVDQKIVIGEDIEIMVVRIKEDRVYLGITAPQEVPVHRLEVLEAIRREDQQE